MSGYIEDLPKKVRDSIPKFNFNPTRFGITENYYIPCNAHLAFHDDNGKRYSEILFNVTTTRGCCGIHFISEVNTHVPSFFVGLALKKLVSQWEKCTFNVFLVVPQQAEVIEPFLENGFYICSSFQNNLHPDGRTIYQLIKQYKDNSIGKKIYGVGDYIKKQSKFLKRQDIV